MNDSKEQMDCEKIAQYLLENKLFLTALEFYQENIEKGTTIKSLLEFFLYKMDTELPFLDKKGSQINIKETIHLIIYFY